MARRWRWLWALGLTLLSAVGCWLLVPGSGPVADVVASCAASAFAAFACLDRTAGEPPPSWRFAGWAAGSWCAGELVFGVTSVGLGVAARPSVGDLGFVASSVLAVMAVLRFPSAPRRGLDRWAAVLDGIVAAGSVALVILLLPLLGGPSGITQLAAVSMAYPVGDAIMVALLLSAASRLPAGQARPLGWASAGIVALAATNLVELGALRAGTYGPGALLDLGCVLGFGLIAVGGLLQQAPTRWVEGRVGLARRLGPDLPLVAAVVLAGVRSTALERGEVVLLGAVVLIAVARHVLVNLQGDAAARAQAGSERALAASEYRHRRIVETAEEGIWVVDVDGVTTFINARAAGFLGLTPDDVLGRRALEVIAPFLDPQQQHDVHRRRARRAEGLADRYELTLRRPDGVDLSVWISAAPLFTDDGRVDGALTMITDLTEQQRLQGELELMAFSDPLTMLPNRAAFSERTREALVDAATTGGSCAVLFVDLDGFKRVNDTLGHLAGDGLLEQVAQRLAAVVEADHVLSRFGGDEFALLAPRVGGAAEAEAIAQGLLRALVAPFTVQGRVTHVTASIGIALSEPGVDVPGMLRNADMAMYAAKAGGRARHRVFAPAMHQVLLARLALEEELRAAWTAGHFAVHLQPIVELPSNDVVGAEALLRWNHPERGTILPGEFIDVAEQSSLIVGLGQWVLEESCASAARITATAGRPFTVAVNVVPRQLAEPGFVEVVGRALSTNGLPPRQLILELTERALADPAGMLPVLEGLRELGVRIALDDFGTGFSSLAQLTALPIDIVKLDRSYVDGVARDAGKRAIAESVVHIGQALGLGVVAEGIEDEADRAVLRDAGCTRAQGWLFARAMPEAQLVGLLLTPPALPAQRAPGQPSMSAPR